MCINETFNSYMILNNVIGSIHHYHNILFVIVCQSSIHNVFCVPYLLDQMPWLVLILPINFVQLLIKSGDYSRSMFISLSQSLRWHGRGQSSIERLLLLLIGLLRCFEFASLVHNKFSRVHVLHMQVFITPATATIWEWHLFCSAHVHGGAAVYCSRAATNQEQCLIERIQYLTCLVSSIYQH